LRITRTALGAVDVIEASFTIHQRATADIHNPLRFVQSRTIDFVSVELLST